MTFYRFKGKNDLWLGKYGNCQQTLIPNELKTEKEIQRIKNTCPRLSIDKTFEKIDIPNSETYTSFGVRFQNGYDHNGKTESIKEGRNSMNKKIPYDLVSTLVILRDWVDVNDAYLNDEHKTLVDIADYLYNNGSSMYKYLKDESKEIYNKYGAAYFDDVLNDASAIDTQINQNNVEDLIAEYNDKATEFDDNFVVDESLHRKSVKENSIKLKIREVSHSELSPSYDSRKSFYGKAHVVTDNDGTQILYSYDTPVVEIRNGKVKLLSQWDSSQTTLRHVKEFLQQNGFNAGSKAQIAKIYGTAVESVRRPNRKSVKEAKENTNYVVFRKYYNEYTDTWEPIAFYWGDNVAATYGRVNITEQDGNVPFMKTPRYVHDEADFNYIVKTKKLTPADECYDEFTEYVINELGEDGYNVVIKQRLDNDAIRRSWR